MNTHPKYKAYMGAYCLYFQFVSYSSYKLQLWQHRSYDMHLFHVFLLPSLYYSRVVFVFKPVVPILRIFVDLAHSSIA